MKTRFILSTLVFGLISLTQASAVGLDLEGYFRTRANFHYNLDLDRGEKPNSRNYFDMRFRLNPTFLVTDRVRIYTSLNMLDGALGEDAFFGSPHGNPAASKDVIFDSGNDSRIGRSIPADERSSWVYGGAYAPDAAARTTELTPVQLRRAWAEVETDYGIVKAGRMPFHFGLGIYANAGDDINQEIGTTRDRVAFETALGPYYLMPGIGWFYEGSLDRSQDDAYEYFFLLGRQVEGSHVALYLSYFAQDEALDTTQNGDLAGENSSYWLIDLYVDQMIKNLRLEVEGALFAGTFLGRDLFAMNAVARGTYKKSAFSLLGEAGFSSGTTQADLDDNKIRTYAFNRDYNVSYLVFEEALPGGKSTFGDAADDERETAPHSGAISNTAYGRAKLGYEVSSWFHPYLNVIVPIAAQDAPNAGGNFYGVEYALITMWPFSTYFSGEFTFAHFIPGSFYKDTSAKDQTFLVRAGLNVLF